MAITNVTGSLSSSLRREEAATSAATDRDISIMRLQANIRATEDRVEEVKKEVCSNFIFAFLLIKKEGRIPQTVGLSKFYSLIFATKRIFMVDAFSHLIHGKI